MSDYFYGQGKVYAGVRVGNVIKAFRWLLDVSELKASLTTETKEFKESYSGQRATAKKIVTGKSLSLTWTMMERSKENVALALYGTTTSVAQGSVTGEALPAGLVAGDRVPLLYPGVSQVAITDSAASPATVDPSKYVVDAVYGAITFNDVSSATQPFKVAYTHGAAESVSVFTTPQPEIFLRYEGINIAEGGAPAIAEFYRVATEPLKELSLISTDVSGMQLTGEALIDSSRPASMEFGQFGRLIRPTA